MTVNIDQHADPLQRLMDDDAQEPNLYQSDEHFKQVIEQVRALIEDREAPASAFIPYLKYKGWPREQATFYLYLRSDIPTPPSMDQYISDPQWWADQLGAPIPQSAGDADRHESGQAGGGGDPARDVQDGKSSDQTFGDIFDASSTFADLGLSDNLLKGVAKAGFDRPTAIQAQLIPAILAGQDVIGQARTGTGKTAAFGLPILQLADPNIRMQALVLSPTRELAAQVAGELDELGEFTPIRTSCIIGGESMRQQQKSVTRGGHIIVGTPGRIMDMQARGQIHFNDLRLIVLDEVDRMLDIGFREDIRRILKSVGREHQTVFCSATISPEIERLGRSFMKPDARKITTVGKSLTMERVDQKYLSVEPWDKRTLLLYLMRHEKPDTTLVFCRTKATVHKVTVYLRDKGLAAKEIHGDLDQSKRNRVMQAMRDGKLDVLVASDLAARGLDVEHITHVINYDLPEDPEIYIHRIGRTARAGRRGVAWSFVTRDEGQRLTEIEKYSGTLIDKLDYSGFKPGPVPQDVRDVREREARRLERSDKPRERQTFTPVDELSEEERRKMFPGGVVPKGPPPKTLGSRFRTRRKR